MELYIDATTLLKELNYKGPKMPKKRCGNCKHSRVTNAGAVIPGLECRLMAKKLVEKGLVKNPNYLWHTDEKGNSVDYNNQVDELYGTCKEWKKK